MDPRNGQESISLAPLNCKRFGHHVMDYIEKR